MDNIITQAAKLLSQGAIISLPTETVYSLSVDAGNDIAVQKLYRLKGRKQDNPLALIVSSVKMARQIVNFNEQAEILAEYFFPGALTLVLPKKPQAAISKFINEGYNTIAVRMPNHQTSLAILRESNKFIVGTSANPSGLPPASSAMQVKEYFADGVDMVVDGGSSEIGFASTIIDLSSNIPRILRQGAVTKAQIEDKIGKIEG